MALHHRGLLAVASEESRSGKTGICWQSIAISISIATLAMRLKNNPSNLISEPATPYSNYPITACSLSDIMEMIWSSPDTSPAVHSIPPSEAPEEPSSRYSKEMTSDTAPRYRPTAEYSSQDMPTPGTIRTLPSPDSTTTEHQTLPSSPGTMMPASPSRYSPINMTTDTPPSNYKTVKYSPQEEPERGPFSWQDCWATATRMTPRPTNPRSTVSPPKSRPPSSTHHSPSPNTATMESPSVIPMPVTSKSR